MSGRGKGGCGLGKGCAERDREEFNQMWHPEDFQVDPLNRAERSAGRRDPHWATSRLEQAQLKAYHQIGGRPILAMLLKHHLDLCVRIQQSDDTEDTPLGELYPVRSRKRPRGTEMNALLRRRFSRL